MSDSAILWTVSPVRLLCPWNSPGKNTGVGFHSLLQGIFQTQGSNLSLLHCRQILYHLSHQGSPYSIVVYYKILSIILCVCMLSHFSPVQVCYPMDCSLPGFSRQEYWRGLPCLPPGDLPNPGMEPTSLIFLALTGRFFITSATWEIQSTLKTRVIKKKDNLECS